MFYYPWLYNANKYRQDFGSCYCSNNKIVQDNCTIGTAHCNMNRCTCKVQEAIGCNQTPGVDKTNYNIKLNDIQEIKS